MAGYVGSSPNAVESAPLLRGAGSYVDDVSLPGQVYARIVRSPLAHARLRAVRTEPASAREGVVAVVTAADVPDLRIPIRMPHASVPEADLALQPPLAQERVRYVGEPVAIVVATDPYVAEDAAE